VDRSGGEEQLTDAVTHRPRGRREAWEALVAHHDRLKEWLVDEGLTAVKAGELLARRGVVVPQRTLHRYALAREGHRPCGCWAGNARCRGDVYSSQALVRKKRNSFPDVAGQSKWALLAPFWTRTLSVGRVAA
jgi:hypothetical protein